MVIHTVILAGEWGGRIVIQAAIVSTEGWGDGNSIAVEGGGM